MKAAYARYRSGDLMVVMSQPWDLDGNLTNFSREGHSACSREYVMECVEPPRAAREEMDRLLAGADYLPGDLEFVPLPDFQREFCSQAKQ